MYCPAAFIENDPVVLHKLIKAHPLGMLVTQSGDILDANHLPLLLHPGPQGQDTLIGHVARANPVWQQVQQGEKVLVVFRAEAGYLSPNWYPSKQATHRQVPTWNYRVVHAHGTIRIHDDARFVRGVLARLTRTHEQHISQQAPWKMGDAPADFLEPLIAAVVGIEITITRLEGKSKLSQNKAHSDIEGAAQGLRDQGNHALADRMLQAMHPQDDTAS